MELWPISQGNYLMTIIIMYFFLPCKPVIFEFLFTASVKGIVEQIILMEKTFTGQQLCCFGNLSP